MAADRVVAPANSTRAVYVLQHCNAHGFTCQNCTLRALRLLGNGADGGDPPCLVPKSQCAARLGLPLDLLNSDGMYKDPLPFRDMEWRAALDGACPECLRLAATDHRTRPPWPDCQRCGPALRNLVELRRTP